MRYIGSKLNLIDEIRNITGKIAPHSQVFCDIFAGTGIVGREFKSTHQIISNDLLYFSYVLNRAYNGISKEPEFNFLKKELRKDPIEYLNSISTNTNKIDASDFITLAYSPAGEKERQYISIENALKIDKIRQTIIDWTANNLVSEEESFYLLASLIEVVPSVSNITGTYGAFLKKWDKRALKPIILSHLNILPTKHKNLVFNQDAKELINVINGDLLYIDPPYNSRQYSSNYHLLETLARYDYPELIGVTGVRKDSAGKSSFCRKDSVYESFDTIIKNAKFNTILISYSSDGLLTEHQLLEIVLKYGIEESLVFSKIPYRRYKSTANDDRNVMEYLIAINK